MKINPDFKKSRQIVSRQNIEFDHPTQITPCDHSVDGPLLGNGDMGIVIGGTAAEQNFYICKNDLWRLQHGYGTAWPVCFGHLGIRIPALKDASYNVRQNLYSATTEGVFTIGEGVVTVKTYIAATRNIFVMELKSTGQAFEGSINMQVNSGHDSQNTVMVKKDLAFGCREFSENVDIPSGAAVAWKISGSKNATLTREGDTLSSSFILEHGKTVRIIMKMDSIFKNKQYKRDVVEGLLNLTETDLLEIRKKHEAWWAQYWDKSYVDINDPVIEKHYYQSLYGMGSCSRDPEFPPGIFGWNTTDTPIWHGDYHLNYNHMAPFYALARSNRIEQADPHDSPLLDFMERAQWHCQEIFGFDGGIYPVGSGPKGIESTYDSQNPNYQSPLFIENKGLFFGQRTNGSYALINMASRWYCTYDVEYGRKIYPFVRQTLTFWENYLTWEPFNKVKDGKAGRYIIDKDSVHEGSGQDLNSCLSLALVRNALELGLDMSKELAVDDNCHERWHHILDHLSDFSVQERDGKRVFRYTEKGTDWWPNNTLGIQHVYPAGQIHLNSDPKLIETSRNTIEVMGRWSDFNGTTSFFPAAVRVGYDPAKILRELRKYSKHTYPNGFQKGNPHGIENFSTTPNTINMMLCMSHLGIIRLFPAWPKSKDASFVNIRCWGAFLVSAELKAGKVCNVRILSEKGHSITIVNPWPEKSIQVTRNGKQSEIISGKRITLETKSGEWLEIQEM